MDTSYKIKSVQMYLVSYPREHVLSAGWTSHRGVWMHAPLGRYSLHQSGALWRQHLWTRSMNTSLKTHLKHNCLHFNNQRLLEYGHILYFFMHL